MDIKNIFSITGHKSERIAKRISRAGICSRRDAELYIRTGRVKLNGVTIRTPALNVDLNDRILVDDISIPKPKPTKLWRYNKPRGLVVTRRDERNRPTIFENLPSHLPRLLTVGRLDLDSEGLLLMTNDGNLARYLELPETGWSRKYRVRVHGSVDDRDLSELSKGITIDGIRYDKVFAKLDRQMKSNAWITISIREGKNREVRRILRHIGHDVNRLIRISYGPFQLGDLLAGEIRQVNERVLSEQLGLKELQGEFIPNKNITTGEPEKKQMVRRGKNASHRRKQTRRNSQKPKHL